MAFMQPEITDLIAWERDSEGMVYPAGTIDQDLVVDRFAGYGARLSAPGFMDCTDWCVLSTVSEARHYLVDNYMLCSVCLGELDNWVCPNCDTEEKE